MLEQLLRPLLVLSLLAAGSASAQVAFKKGGGQLEISVGGEPFATYVWEDAETTRPYFKQVHSPGGIQVTRQHPPAAGDIDDHGTYHPGIWWGFGDVGGNDYWRMKAKIIGGDFIEEAKGGAERGTFAVRNRMLVNGSDETFCTQISRFMIMPKTNGVLMVCETALQREESDFWLGDQEEMGLGIRMATPIAMQSKQGGRILDSNGRTRLNEIRTNQADWCDHSGPIEGRFAGITLMNDPANFRRPWWHAVDNGLLVANPLGESELKGRGKKKENVLVKKGRPFQLRYGVFVHANARAEDLNLKGAYADFLKLVGTEGPPQKPRASELPN